MSTITQTVLASRIVAIVRLERYDQAVALTEALLAGGIEVIEFTLTGEGANEAIAATRAVVSERAYIGVGTVLDPRTAREAVAAGAQFIVTPVVRPAVIEVGRALGVPVFSGAFTPTEALTAHEAGADFIKIFPARLGTPHYLRDILAPLPFLRLVPTGGVNADNARAYLEAGAVAVAIGGGLVSEQSVASQNWEQITARARACVEAVRSFTV
ncbi:MAG: bifunctional 4-hydroxy-2-oxoglutarate aldolase/2-dehydro-3-deoxy-phosphogluconate aldolase [Chloroflexota bacterium]|nr:bifunctional 4-hydroxy-2-oxoglutarate aldolase/2-dehydro-3-deoxy-phosphogluconate aldolase [Chloroflexota bacterium]